MTRKNRSKKQVKGPTRGVDLEFTWHDRLIFYSLLAMVFVLPALIFPLTADIFELPKVTLLRLWILFVLALWAMNVYQTGSIRLRRTALDKPVLFLGFAAVVSTLFSLNPLLSSVGSYYRYEGIFTVVAYLLLFFVATQFLQRGQIRLLVYVLLASVGLNALYGVFQHYGYDFIRLTGTVFELSRSSGGLGNPVFLGALLTTTISLPLVGFLGERSALSRALLLLVFGLLAVCLMFTSTRAAWLGAGAQMLVLALFWREGLVRERTKLVALVSFAVLLAFFLLTRFYLPTRGTVAERLFSIVQPRGSAATRLDMWKGSLRLVRDRPVLGSGWENFEGTFPLYGTKFLMSQEELPDRPHNQLLYVTTSAGLVGLLAYLWLILSALALAGRRLVTGKIHPDRRLWLAGILAGVVGYVIQEQFSISSAGVAPIFWLFLAVIGRESGDREVYLRRPVSAKTRSAVLVAVAFVLLIGSTFNLRFLWADMLYRRGLRSSSAEQPALFRRVVELNPYVNKYRSALAQVYAEDAFRYQDAQLLQEAIIVYEEGLRINPRDEAMWIQVGDLYLARQDASGVERAVEAYERVLDLHPLSAGANWALGDLYRSQQDNEKALLYLTRAASLVPDHVEVLTSLAQAHLQSGSFQKAREVYLRVLAIDPESETAREALARLNQKPE